MKFGKCKGPVIAPSSKCVMEGLERRQLLSAAIAGTVYNDANGNHLRDAAESALPGAQVYLDINGINQFVAGDPVATADANGVYSFSGLAAGNYLVRPVPVAGRVTTTPIYGGKFFVQLGANQTVAGKDFGLQTAATPNFTVNGQLLIAATLNGQATLTRYNANDGSTDVTFGSLGVVTLPASVIGQPSAATAQGSSTVITYPTQTVTLDASGNVVSIISTGGGGDILSNPPTNLSAAPLGPQSIKITFTDNATNEDAYEIQRAASAAGPWSVVDVQAGTATTGQESFTDTSVVANTTYLYRVVGTKGATGLSAYAGPVSATTPAQVTSGGTISGHLTGSDGFEQIYLDLQGIDRYVAGDPIVTPDASGNYLFTGLAAGNYLVRVVPRSNFFTTAPVYGGKHFIQLGANQTVAGQDFTVQFAQSFPAGSQFLVAGASNGQDTLTRYTIDQSTDVFFGSLGVVTLPASVQGDPTNVTFQSSGNTVVTYPNAIVTLSGSGGILSIAPIGQGINAPTGLTATAISPTSVQLGFTDNSTNDSGFVIERATSSNGPFTSVGTLPGNVTGPSTGFVGFADNSAAANTTYFYRVYAVNGAAQSSPAGPVSVTTPAGQTAGGSISGTVFNDNNFDGISNQGDAPVAGRQVYLDLKGLGVFATGDPVSTTDANGHYTFTGLPAANYLVRLVPQAGSVISAPVYGGKYYVQLANNQAVAGDDFGTHDVSGALSATQSDGKLLVVDVIAASPATITGHVDLRRFNPDGSLDVTYGHLGSVPLLTGPFPSTLGPLFIKLTPDGSALVGTRHVVGQLQSDDQQLFLVSPAGQIVNSDFFTFSDLETDRSELSSAIFLPNGDILGIGATQRGSGSELLLKRYSSNLSVMYTISQGLIFGQPTTVAGLPDGSIQLVFPNDQLTLSPTLAIEPTRVLATPTGLTATALSPTSVRVQFNDNSTNEQSFIITRTTDSYHSGPVVATVPGSTGTGVRSFLDTSVVAGETYIYNVYAVNGAVRSLDAGTVRVLTPTS